MLHLTPIGPVPWSEESALANGILDPPMAKESGRRLTVIMFTDMVGYSSLTEQDEAGALALLEVQTRLMEPILVMHGGRLVRTMGDGTFIEFGSAVSACKAALEIQDAIAHHNETGAKFQIRIGIHLGDVEAVDGDLLGHGVNVAARIEPIAEPGGVCVSEDVARQVKGRFEGELQTIGIKHLKGIQEGVMVYSVAKQRPREGSQKPLGKNLPSVAVMPFANVSPDLDNEFFADGLTEEILWALSKIRTLSVVSRTSCFAMKGASKPISEVGRILAVDHILEGSVKRSGNRIRVAVQLVDISKDLPLWTDRFDRELEDIFEIQEEITKSIVDALQITISEREMGAIFSIPTRNVRAYEAYVRALSMSWTTPLEAIPLFQEAVEHDPSFAKAYAMLGLCSLHALRFFAGEDRRFLQIARESASRAVDLSPMLSEAHAAMAEVAYQEDRIDDAIIEYEAALALDPHSYEALYSFGRLLLVVGDRERAVTCFLRAAEVRPDEYHPLCLSVSSYEAEGSREIGLEALARVERRILCDPSDARALMFGALLHQRIGEEQTALQYVERALHIDSTAGTLYNAACLYCIRGDTEQAIQTLERSYELGINFAEWINHDCDLKPIVDHPRVQSVLARMRRRMAGE